MKGKSLTNIFKGDKVIWMIFFFLCMISIIEVYSASSSLTLKKGYYWAPIMDHAKKIILGVVALVCVLNVECKYFKMATPFALGGSIIMILWVLVGGETINGANRWITFFGIQFQPSELAKGALVLATAQILSAMQTDKGADRKAFRYILLLSAWIIIPIAMENGSTAFLLAITIFVMMFVGRVPLDQLGKLFGVMAVIATIALSVIMIYGKTEQERAKDPRHQLTEQMAKAKTKQPKTLADRFEDRLDTWKSRIVKFTNPEDVPANKVNLRDKDSQKNYSHIAIASSGIVGKGPGNSTARDGLAQAFSDFIYAIIIEELGIIGATFVALLYVFLLFRVAIIANRCENNFPAFLAMGLTLMLVIQALFNMLVAVGLAPVTGQPLPLISRGGTSTVINCIYMGMILSVSRSAKKKAAGSIWQG